MKKIKDECYSVKDAAIAMGLPYTTFYMRMKGGDIPTPDVIIGKREMYSRRQFDAVLTSQPGKTVKTFTATGDEFWDALEDIRRMQDEFINQLRGNFPELSADMIWYNTTMKGSLLEDWQFASERMRLCKVEVTTVFSF